MDSEVIIRIDASMPAGRRFIRDFEKTRTRHRDKSVKIEYPLLPDMDEKEVYSVKEVFDMVEKKLNDHYGTNYKL